MPASRKVLPTCGGLGPGVGLVLRTECLGQVERVLEARWLEGAADVEVATDDERGQQTEQT